MFSIGEISKSYMDMHLLEICQYFPFPRHVLSLTAKSAFSLNGPEIYVFVYNLTKYLYYRGLI